MSYKEAKDCVIDGDVGGVEAAVKALLDEKADPLEIINQGLLEGMNVVGERFKAGDMFIPEVLMCARAMDKGMALVKPFILEGDMPNLGTVVIGTVAGDLHDIGKNLVTMMMESAGFKVIDLGVDVTPEQFAAAAKENNAQIVAMSAMLTTTMESMEKVIEACKAQGITSSFMVGGAPVSTMFAEKIGAYYTSDSSTAVDKVKELIA